jgi:hypothetical protein
VQDCATRETLVVLQALLDSNSKILA